MPDEVAVALVGHVCIDRNVIDEVRAPQRWGSAVMYAAAHFAGQRGVRCEMIAPHGRDFVALWPTVRFLNEANSEATLTYQNTVNGHQAERRCWNAGSAVLSRLSDAQRSAVGRADILILAPLLPTCTPEFVDDLVSASRAHAVRVLLGQGYLRAVTASGRVDRCQSSALDSVLDRFGTVVVSDDDIAQNWTDSRSIAAGWARAHPALDVVVTRNARGAVLFRDGTEEAFSTDPLDGVASAEIIGAGDTFGAALALELARSGDIRKAIVIANATAREFVAGGRSSVEQPDPYTVSVALG